MKLAIFDFDGTITNKDSFEDFIFYSYGGLKTFMGIAATSPALISYGLGLMPNWKAKQRVFSHFYQGWDLKRFDAVAVNYSRERLPVIIRPPALTCLEWHKKEGHRIVIASASFENYLRPWCGSYGFDLLGTRVEVKNGQLTGQFATRNCYGEEKINRLQEAYRLDEFEFIYAYGDSQGDRELAKIANEFHFRPFLRQKAA